MAKWKYAAIIINFFCTLFLVLLPLIDDQTIRTVDNPIFKAFLLSCKDNKFYCALLPAIVIAGFNGFSFLILPTRTLRTARLNILTVIYSDVFKNDNKIRITLFEDASFIRNCWYNFQLALHQLMRHPGKLFNSLEWPRYIYVKQRVGIMHPNSKTYLRFSTDTEKKSMGVAGRVRYEKSYKYVRNLPDIHDIDLSEIDIKNNRSPVTRTVREYMRRSFMRGNFRALKRMNCKAQQIYGFYVEDNANIPSGVLVIDVFKNNWDIGDKKDEITTFVRLLGRTYNKI